MKIFIKLVISVLCFFYISIAASAQNQMHFGEKINYITYREKVLNYNQNIKKSAEMTLSYEAAVKKIRTGFYPNLSASANASYNFVNHDLNFGVSNLPIKNYNYSVGATIQQNVYSGSIVRNNWLAAKIQAEMSKLGEQLTTDNVVYMADVTYWGAVAQKENFKSMLKYDSIVNSLYNIVKARFEDGYVSKTDLLMVETRKKEGEFMLSGAKKNYITSIQNLNIMMGENVNANLDLTDSIQLFIPIPEFLPLDSVLLTRPDYVIAQKQIDLQERMTKAALSKFLPQFVVGIDGNWGSPSINIDGKGLFNAVVYGQLNIPIFHWLERQHTKEQNKAIVRAYEQEKSLLQDDINQQLSNAVTNLLESFQMMQIAKSSFDIATSNLELNTFSYNEGKLPIIDVLSSQLSWLTSLGNLIDANYNYKVSYASYEKAVGGLNR